GCCSDKRCAWRC
nr:Chain A, Alpha-conotoxin ImI [synthetic construct]